MTRKQSKAIQRTLHFLGSFGIFVGFAVITYWLWQQGIKENIFPGTFSTSILLSDTLSGVATAAPLALISINGLFAKSMIRLWGKKLKTAFKH